MYRSAARLVVAVWMLWCFPGTSTRADAQSAGSVRGTTTAATSGQQISNARITAKNTATGAISTTTSDSKGEYFLHDLQPGDYAISVEADGLAAKTSNFTISAGKSQRLDFLLTDLPTAPAAAPAAPSLNDLGFTAEQTQANPQLQAMLTRRTEMLRIHQRLGLITAIPMAAAVITGPMANAKGRNGQPIKEPTQANLDTHIALGGATTALYLSTAYFAMFAPRVPGTEKHGAIRWHEALAWIHGPGMILTPALGIMAYKQENAGEKVHGIASAHAPVAYITALSYGNAIVAISWPIHVKFWEKH
jgi:Carboxypeptidase regulatory-like domain